MRPPLLGVYALLAEWHALLAPGTEPSVARIKLAWWSEELQRLSTGTAVHPICRYLDQLPTAAAADWTPLAAAVEAAAWQVAGVPLERGSELEAHSCALLAGPLRLVGRLAGIPPANAAALNACTAALAAGDYLARASAGYAADVRVGRIPFAVDELLAAGIEDADLMAAAASPGLQRYLDQLTRQAAQYFESAGRLLPPPERPAQRHLLVLAAVSLRQLRRGAARSHAGTGLLDMYAAWTTARRASMIPRTPPQP